MANASDKVTGSVHPIVMQIIDRDCHVGTPSRDVVRHVISKLKRGYDTYRAMSPEDRSLLVEQCVRHHRGNLKMYVEVMSGFTRSTGKEVPELPLKLSGSDIASLMRKHKWTIRALALRLGTTMKRVREARDKGLTDAFLVRDWTQAITGVDPGPIPSPFRIEDASEIEECHYCGFPFVPRDEAYKYADEAFCSITCCRKSRAW